ncbi:MAG: hypothetical protein CR982_06135 [Candidatus Cloacimonadota bacterium]|nr:MAG: hypothetical protein CR982_06135 [Candidatus Cloacimonadota bacterium]PIE78099.1 MAG: hypothetical protein CSA15_09695 [Candidatus Delongbacteria bacterium]
MKKIITVLMMLVLSMALLAKNNDFWPKRVIVQLSDVKSVKFSERDGLSSGIQALDQLGKEIRVNNFKPLFDNTEDRLSKEYGLDQFYILDYSGDQTERSVIDKLEKIDNVLTAELDEKYELYYTPTDSLVSEQWYLTKTETDEAWDTQQGAEGVIIAIIDSGVKINHRDLRQAMWHNEAEINGAPGVDDDGNGKVDDFYGWDFSDGDNILDHDFTMPGGNGGEDHGTHCSGIAAATDHTSQPQQTGIVGVGFGAKIMGVKIFPNSYPSTTSPAIKYAADNGARVSSNSWGGGSFNTANRNAVNYSTAKGCIFVAAAGNENTNQISYPAGYENAVSVGATTSADFKTSFSNYGDWVTICAPGSSILSTTDPSISNGHSYEEWPGTSMATPIVSGGAAILLANKPGMFPANEDGVNLLRDYLEDYGDEPLPYSNGDKIGLRINLKNSINAINGSSPWDDININPSEINIVVNENSTATQTITLTNNSSSAFDFTAAIQGSKDIDYSKLSLNGEELSSIPSEGSVETEPVKDEVAIAHHDGNLNSGIGTGAAAEWISAARFDNEDLATLYGSNLTKVSLAFNSLDFSSLILHVWEGGSENDPGTEIYSQNITSMITEAQTWETITLTNPIPLVSGNEYWIGYEISATGDHPSGCDVGPMVPNKGGWIYMDGNWEQLANIAATLDFNWCITGLVEADITPWLTLENETGTIPAGGTATFDVNFNSGSYPLGTSMEGLITLTNGNNIPHPTGIPVTMSVGSGIDEIVAKDFTLDQNYPNPFNPETTINFNMNRTGEVEMMVYNSKGEIVKNYASRQLKAGSHSFKFDGSGLNSGVYYYTITVNGIKDTRKMTLIK